MNQFGARAAFVFLSAISLVLVHLICFVTVTGTVTTKEAEQEEESSDEKDSVRRPRDTTCGPELVKTEKGE